MSAATVACLPRDAAMLSDAAQGGQKLAAKSWLPRLIPTVGLLNVGGRLRTKNCSAHLSWFRTWRRTSCHGIPTGPSRSTHNPVSRKAIDFSQTPMAAWRLQFFEELKRLRKVALRLGYLNERSACWTLRPDVFKKLLTKQTTLDELTDRDVRYDVRQKGVDMRLGLDIAIWPRMALRT